MTRSTNHASCDEVNEVQLPAVEAILAGTLALMTGHAQAGSPCERQAMRGKIASNIDLLARHAQLSPTFRRAMGQLCAHWRSMEGRGRELDLQGGRWYDAPGTLQ